MFEIRDMRAEDREAVLPMVIEFYNSDAVEHSIPKQIPGQVFLDAVNGHSMLRGIVLTEAQRVVGFAYLSWYYACEVAGMTLMIEEVYLQSGCRGKGYGKAFFDWLFQEYKDAKRFRLEVTDCNEGALRLYQGLGFERLGYGQMVRDI